MFTSLPKILSYCLYNYSLRLPFFQPNTIRLHISAQTLHHVCILRIPTFPALFDDCGLPTVDCRLWTARPNARLNERIHSFGQVPFGTGGPTYSY